MPKMNQEGNFTPFAGVTVVAPISSDNLHFWREIYHFLASDPVVMQHYTLLPCESYHMTTHNLYTEEFDAPGNWPQFIEENLYFFETLSHNLRHLKISPQIEIQQGIVTDHVLQLILTIPEQEKNKITGLASLIGLQTSVPYPFHLTLAYQKKELDPLSKLQLAQRLLQKINLLLITNAPLSMNSSALCYFHDMQKFIPWDGIANPFKREPLHYFHPLTFALCPLDETKKNIYLVENEDTGFSLYGPEWIESYSIDIVDNPPRFWTVDVSSLLQNQFGNPIIFPNNVLTTNRLTVEEVKSYLKINPSDRLTYKYNQVPNLFQFNYEAISKRMGDDNVIVQNIPTENLYLNNK